MPGRGEIRVDAKDLRTLLGAAKDFDKSLATGLRRNIRAAANIAAEDSRREIRSAPSTGRDSHAMRQGIAKGIRVQVATGTRINGVFIKSTGSGLPAKSRSLARAMDKPSFRHPVFGNRQKWQPQKGHPYFRTVISRHLITVNRAVERAVGDALEVMARHK